MGLKELTDRVVDAFKPVSPETAEARRLIEQYRAEVTADGKTWYYDIKASAYAPGRAILESEPRVQANTVKEIFLNIRPGYGSPLMSLQTQLFSRNLPYSEADLEAFLKQASSTTAWEGQWGAVIRVVRRYTEEVGARPLSLEAGLKTLRAKVKQYSSADNRKIVMQIDELLGSTSVGRPDPGDVWADRALSDLAAMPPEAQSAWAGLFAHAATADGSKPNAKWLAEAARHRQAVGAEDLSRRLAAWLSLVAPPPAFDRVAPKYEATDYMNNAPLRDEYQRASAEYYAALKEYQSGISEKNVSLLSNRQFFTGKRPVHSGASGRRPRASARSASRSGSSSIAGFCDGLPDAAVRAC